MTISAAEIANIVKGTVEGDPNVLIHGPSRIENGLPGTISFLAHPKYEPHIYSTNASAIMVHEDFSPTMKINPSLIRVKNVVSSISKIFEHFQNIETSIPHISQDAYIDDSCTIGHNVTIEKLAVIEKNVRIGKNCFIHAHVYIGQGVTIGNNTILYPGVKIYHDCKIGNNCIIHSNTVIGSDGFGYYKDKGSSYTKVPQIGNVLIENNVEIGANSVVDRATIGSTRIRDGVKLDNLIQIAHNVDIGKDTAIAAQVGIAGSTKIGERVVIGGQAGLIGHINIADDSKIQAQSGVAGDINKANTKVYGYPAIDYNTYLRAYVHFKSLPELTKKILDLQSEIENIKSSLKK